LTLPADGRPEAPAPASPAPAAHAVLPPGLVFADTYSRFAAYLLDGVVLSIPTSLVPVVLGMYDYAYSYPPEPIPRATLVGLSVFSICIQAAYFLWFWTGGRRATVGQRVFGIQIGNAFDGQPLTMTQAVTRWLAMGWWISILLLLPFLALAVVGYIAQFVWLLILFISIVVSPTKQGIHDRIARSALVRPAGPTSRWAIGCLWLFVGFAIFEAVFLVVFIGWMNDLQDAGLYPPGMNPIDIFVAQIREFWPS
jgi:uncharacterized RDD family membrane protein YckC